MKTTINELFDTLNNIENVCTGLYHLSIDPNVNDHESDLCKKARDLLIEYKEMILRTKVDV